MAQFDDNEVSTMDDLWQAAPPPIGSSAWLQQRPNESSADYAARLNAWDASDKRTPQSIAATQARIDGVKRDLQQHGQLDPALQDANTQQLAQQDLAQLGSATPLADSPIIPGLPDFKLPDLSGIGLPSLGNLWPPDTKTVVAIVAVSVVLLVILHEV